jgi:hypothetical protein
MVGIRTFSEMGADLTEDPEVTNQAVTGGLAGKNK